MQKPTQKSKNAHTDDLVDHYWGTINYVTSLIKSSELKAGFILSFYGILLNFIYQGIESFTNNFGSDFILTALIFIWVLCTSLSIYFCVKCFIPRIEDKFSVNMFFFKDIITKFGDIKSFSKTFYSMSTDENEIFQQLGEQIYIMSKIADLKFKNVMRAVKLLALSLIIFLIAGVYQFVIV